MYSDYLFLFASAFGSATFLPGASEIVFLALLHNEADLAAILITASVGNSLGSIVKWWLGKYLLRFKSKAWFPVSPGALQKAQSWFARYGVWSLLLAWMPIFGDALTLVAGLMRTRILIFFILTLIGKTSRYAVLAAVYLGLF